MLVALGGARVPRVVVPEHEHRVVEAAASIVEPAIWSARDAAVLSAGADRVDHRERHAGNSSRGAPLTAIWSLIIASWSPRTRCMRSPSCLSVEERLVLVFGAAVGEAALDHHRVDRARRSRRSRNWLDTLSRELLETGEFARLVREDSITGATSNPTIFAKALIGSDRYDDQLREAVESGVETPVDAFLELALEDVRRAARELRGVYDETGGKDGFVSFECTPDLADDTEATIEQALDLWKRLDAPNVMIKVPGTPAGVPAIEELTARGMNINVTLLFAVYALRGGHRRLPARARAPRRGRRTDRPHRLGGLVLRLAHRHQGRQRAARRTRRCGEVAVANARSPTPATSRRSPATAGRPRGQGAAPQRPLWASTGTKNDAYSDVLYVERLIAPGVVNTMP